VRRLTSARIDIDISTNVGGDHERLVETDCRADRIGVEHIQGGGHASFGIGKHAEFNHESGDVAPLTFSVAARFALGQVGETNLTVSDREVCKANAEMDHAGIVKAPKLAESRTQKLVGCLAWSRRHERLARRRRRDDRRTVGPSIDKIDEAGGANIGPFRKKTGADELMSAFLRRPKWLLVADFPEGNQAPQPIEPTEFLVMTKDSNHDGCRGRIHSIGRNVPIGNRNNRERSQANPLDNRFDESQRRATTGRPPDEVHDGSDNQTHTPARHDINGKLSADEQSREPDQHHHDRADSPAETPDEGHGSNGQRRHYRCVSGRKHSCLHRVTAQDDLIHQFVGRPTANSESQNLGNQPCDGATHKKST
jgi:hypothetical protein